MILEDGNSATIFRRKENNNVHLQHRQRKHGSHRPSLCRLAGILNLVLPAGLHGGGMGRQTGKPKVCQNPAGRFLLFCRAAQPGTGNRGNQEPNPGVCDYGSAFEGRRGRLGAGNRTGNCKRVERYAIKKEPGIFDKGHLARIAGSLKEGYELKLIDKEIFQQTKKSQWSVDFTSQFSDYGDYQERGLGAAVLAGGELVAGASSYTVYQGGIEIEIGTREDYRRKGLASACGAKLVLECMERGLYPSWDAQNWWSVKLAEKLGYHFDRAYPAYEVYNLRQDTGDGK